MTAVRGRFSRSDARWRIKANDSVYQQLRQKQFAASERIVIAAPFWDGSFSAVLKLYLENIYVTGIVSRYGSDGIPIGMCKANELIYVTTAGGPYTRDYSFNYIKALATNCFGIEAVRLIMAENLDVDPAKAGSILSEAIRNLTE